MLLRNINATSLTQRSCVAASLSTASRRLNVAHFSMSSAAAAASDPMKRIAATTSALKAKAIKQKAKLLAKAGVASRKIEEDVDEPAAALETDDDEPSRSKNDMLLNAAVKVSHNAREFKRVAQELGLDAAAALDDGAEFTDEDAVRHARLVHSEARKIEREHSQFEKELQHIRAKAFSEIEAYRLKHLQRLLDMLNMDRRVRMQAKAEGRIVTKEELQVPEALEYEKSPFYTFYDFSFLQSYLKKKHGVMDSRYRQYARRRNGALLEQLADSNDPVVKKFTTRQRVNSFSLFYKEQLENIPKFAAELGIEYDASKMNMRKYLIKIVGMIWRTLKEQNAAIVQQYQLKSKEVNALLQRERIEHQASQQPKQRTRSASAYMLYCGEHFAQFRQKIEEETGQKVSVGNVQLAQMFSQGWRELSEQEKNRYVLMSLQKQKEFLQDKLELQRKKLDEAKNGVLPIKTPTIVSNDESSVVSIEVFNTEEEYEKKYGRIDDFGSTIIRQTMNSYLEDFEGEEEDDEPSTYYDMLDTMEEEEEYLDGQ